MKLLSTKILPQSLTEKILLSGMEYQAYDAIQIEYLPIPPIPINRGALITSKNTLNAFQAVNKTDLLKDVPLFCIGDKTKALAEALSLNVECTEENSTKLAHKIISEYSDWSFTYFCSNLRRPELPDLLKENGISFDEGVVYNTLLNSREFSASFDGILFFSPSGAKSFLALNELKGAFCFCIGSTTAAFVENYSNRIYIAEHSTYNSLVDLALQTLLN